MISDNHTKAVMCLSKNAIVGPSIAVALCFFGYNKTPGLLFETLCIMNLTSIKNQGVQS